MSLYRVTFEVSSFLSADGRRSDRETRVEAGRHSKRDVTSRQAFLRRRGEVSSGRLSGAV